MKAKLLLFIAPVLLLGQDKGVSTTLPAGPTYTEVKQYLNLTDAQLQSLTTIVANRSQAQTDISNQISLKYKALSELMNAGTGTATQLGQIMVDIQNLQRQIPVIDGPYKNQAQNVVTADQKTKLARLSEAMQLQMTASEAVSLLLIDYPNSRGPVFPVDLGGSIGNAVAAPATR